MAFMTRKTGGTIFLAVIFTFLYFDNVDFVRFSRTLGLPQAQHMPRCGNFAENPKTLSRTGKVLQEPDKIFVLSYQKKYSKNYIIL